MTNLLRDCHGASYFHRISPKALHRFMPGEWANESTWIKCLRTKKTAAAKKAAVSVIADCAATFRAGRTDGSGKASAAKARPPQRYAPSRNRDKQPIVCWRAARPLCLLQQAADKQQTQICGLSACFGWRAGQHESTNASVIAVNR